MMQIALGFYRKKRVTSGVETINKEANMGTNTTTNIPDPSVTDWGFWNTMNEHASAAWPIASAVIAAGTGCEPEQVRAFLDSRFGRHFADDVRNSLYFGSTLKDAIDTATQKWMTWTIGRNTAKQTGIPRGLPYLTGFVIHCGLIEETTPTQQ